MKWVNRLYIFFVGIILTVTTGFGIAAFYPQPTRPDYPTPSYVAPLPTSCYETPVSRESAECKQIFAEQEKKTIQDALTQREYETKLRTYENVNAGYTRTAIFFGIAIGSMYASMSIATIKKSKLVATGLMLAGVLTAIFTRLLIALASLGASVSGTNDATMAGYLQFFILLMLSTAIVFIGLFNLKDESTQK